MRRVLRRIGAFRALLTVQSRIAFVMYLKKLPKEIALIEIRRWFFDMREHDFVKMHLYTTDFAPFDNLY